MTSGAVVVRRLLRFPVTVKAGRMIDGRGLECSGGRLEVIWKTSCGLRHPGQSLMTDSAVVVLLRALILHGMRRVASSLESNRSNHVLMFVVRKDSFELARLRRLTESEARAVARRDFGVTDRADDWTRAFEKFRAMTASAGGMRRKIRDIWKARRALPVTRRSFVASIASEALMFL